MADAEGDDSVSAVLWFFPIFLCSDSPSMIRQLVLKNRLFKTDISTSFTDIARHLMRSDEEHTEIIFHSATVIVEAIRFINSIQYNKSREQDMFGRGYPPDMSGSRYWKCWGRQTEETTYFLRRNDTVGILMEFVQNLNKLILTCFTFVLYNNNNNLYSRSLARPFTVLFCNFKCCFFNS